MIRIYELKTPNHVYYGIEADKHADIIEKHKRYKFSPALVAEINQATLTILHQTNSLSVAEKLEQYYKGTK